MRQHHELLLQGSVAIFAARNPSIDIKSQQGKV
jgi:hypothetical protein